jgi:hypothetical protein
VKRMVGYNKFTYSLYLGVSLPFVHALSNHHALQAARVLIGDIAPTHGELGVVQLGQERIAKELSC